MATASSSCLLHQSQVNRSLAIPHASPHFMGGQMPPEQPPTVSEIENSSLLFLQQSNISPSLWGGKWSPHVTHEVNGLDCECYPGSKWSTTSFTEIFHTDILFSISMLLQTVTKDIHLAVIYFSVPIEGAFMWIARDAFQLEWATFFQEEITARNNQKQSPVPNSDKVKTVLRQERLTDAPGKLKYNTIF